MTYQIVAEFPGLVPKELGDLLERANFSVYEIDTLTKKIIPTESPSEKILGFSERKITKCIYNGDSLPSEMQAILQKLEEGKGIAYIIRKGEPLDA